MIRPVDPPVENSLRAARFEDAAESAGLERTHPPQPPKRRMSLPRLRQGALLPEAGAAGGSLTAVIAVISALGALALSAFVLIAASAEKWTSDLESSMTIQVKGVDALEIETLTAAAVGVLDETSGILGYNVITSAEAAKRLEPWLGQGNNDFLNVPALIEISAAPSIRSELDALRDRLAAAAPGVVLDDHSAWNERLGNAARTGQALAFGVFALILLACCAIAIFAARAGLSANAEIVSILHLVGATDDFIASEVQRRFFTIGLQGSLIGLTLAVFALGLVALGARARGAASYFAPTFEPGLDLILPLLIVPIAICLATAGTARLTVLGALRREY
jgi:cell division transport system permease protein